MHLDSKMQDPLGSLHRPSSDPANGGMVRDMTKCLCSVRVSMGKLSFSGAFVTYHSFLLQ